MLPSTLAMNTSLRFLIILSALAWAPGTIVAEEKNGVLLSVNRKTVTRSNANGLQKVKTLGVSIRNSSIRDLPAGEVHWGILAYKTYYDSASSSKKGYWVRDAGIEPLKALRPAEGTELILGGMDIDWKDRVEYRVVVMHGDKETISLCTDSDFLELEAEFLAGEEKKRLAAGGLPRPADWRPKPEAGGKGSADDKNDTPPKDGVVPGKNGELPPAVADNPKPAPARVPEPVIPAMKSFDFFNLGKANPRPQG